MLLYENKHFRRIQRGRLNSSEILELTIADILVKFCQAYLSVSVSLYICMYLHMYIYMYTRYTDEILNKRDFAVHAIL